MGWDNAGKRTSYLQAKEVFQSIQIFQFELSVKNPFRELMIVREGSVMPMSSTYTNKVTNEDLNLSWRGNNLILIEWDQIELGIERI